MSAFEKIVGMFGNRELGEKVAQEILNERDHENAQKIMGLVPGVGDQKMSLDHKETFRTALIMAAAEIEPHAKEDSFPDFMDLRPTRQEVRDAECVIMGDAPADVISQAEGILDSAQRYGVRD